MLDDSSSTNYHLEKMRYLLILLFLFSFSVSAVEVLEVSGKIIKFRTIDYEIPLKKRVIIYSRKQKGKKRRKLAIARVISKQGKIYSAKVLKKKKSKKRRNIREGDFVKISKKYMLDSAKGRVSKRKSKKSKGAKNFFLKTRPFGFATGYYDFEAEFALKGSSRSFSLVLAIIGLESQSKTVAGLGLVGKYNFYFSPRAISKGFFLSTQYGFYKLDVEGKSTAGDILNVSIYGPYIGAIAGYQWFIKKKYSITAGGGAGIFITPSEVETTSSAGTASTLEVPLSGFTPSLELSFGYSF